MSLRAVLGMKAGAGMPVNLRTWLLRPAGPAAVATLLAVLAARAAWVAVVQAEGGTDNAFLLRAGQMWLDGRAPYSDRRFLYLPSAVLFAGAESAVPATALRIAAPTVFIALISGGWLSAVRLFAGSCPL